MKSDHLALAEKLAGLFSPLPQVEAVALGGSRGSASVGPDASSDIDIYVYTRGDIPLEARRAVVEQSGGASQANLMLDYWGPGDEWYHAPTGIEVDVIYFDAAWMESQVDRVLVQHQPSMGYTTCLWHTVRQSLALSDPHGWFAALQKRCAVPYPEELRRAIIAFNHPVLRGIIPTYAHQVEKAVLRGDLVSVNHRLAALLASYFDILFAFNRVPHPGEKRLVAFAREVCPRLPEGMENEVLQVLRVSCADPAALPAHLNRLLDNLDALLNEDGLITG